MQGEPGAVWRQESSEQEVDNNSSKDDQQDWEQDWGEDEEVWGGEGTSTLSALWGGEATSTLPPHLDGQYREVNPGKGEEELSSLGVTYMWSEETGRL